MKYRLRIRMGDGNRSALEICSRKMGTTLPLDPMTLPSRTAFIRHCGLLSAVTVNSASRLDAPMMLCGFTALSVDTKTNDEAPCCERRPRQRVCAERIIANCGQRVVFQEGNVLEGRRMIHHPRAKAGEHAVQQFGVRHAAQDGFVRDLVCARHKALLD
jgi:hypothetical protein